MDVGDICRQLGMPDDEQLVYARYVAQLVALGICQESAKVVALHVRDVSDKRIAAVLRLRPEKVNKINVRTRRRFGVPGKATLSHLLSAQPGFDRGPASPPSENRRNDGSAGSGRTTD